MKTARIVSLLTVFLFASLSTAIAEDINTIFKKVNDYIAADNYAKALEELKWAEKEINKMHVNKIKTFLPDELAGLKGNPFKVNSAMGMTNIERDYVSGSQKIKVSVVNGNNSAMGGIAGLGKLAAMMGQQPGQDSFRIEGRTASLMNRSGRAELSVFLDSGTILKFETRTAPQDDGSKLKTVAEAVKIADLDNYLRGTAG